MHKLSFVASTMALCLLSASALHVAAQSESLLIGAGDLLQVGVMDTPEMEQQVRVTDSGTIDLAYLGTIHVAGATPAAGAAEVRSKLIEKHVMRDPQVTIRVVEYSTQNVSILGEVHSPGSYPLTTPQSILKILALAGGLTGDADRHITVKKEGNTQEIPYYVSNDSSQALADAVMIQPGDTVLIPRAPRVYVTGDVARPGGYAIATNDSKLTIMQAIVAAGAANKTSVRSHVRLIRTTSSGLTEIPVNLGQIEKGKDPDLVLQANDVLYVPFSWMKNMAIGSAQIVASTASAGLYLAR